MKKFCNKLNKEISLLGCGWLGFPLAINLTRKGYNVKGSTTSESKLAKLKSNGIIPFCIHLSQINKGMSDFLSSDLGCR
ncbi:MAG: hypothetical protein COC19_04240 [SAR86 cluster bacterium]|uniref:6-phosphogluconate dehydrogenase NADP-binding domain-containing protein n=1 Tax=SAR86 cluster bacterium TaxID=2030880 RepID=A0A2A4MNX4_9GAMM|nr:MAG: hypothetical protein COC19_04240 [SAR86 cluster bacterium]